ncbi:MAG: hypothetical protein U0Z44_21845 [Kouleothrix sp.]
MAWVLLAVLLALLVLLRLPSSWPWRCMMASSPAVRRMALLRADQVQQFRLQLAFSRHLRRRRSGT